MDDKLLIKRLVNIGYTEAEAADLVSFYGNAGKLNGLIDYLVIKEDARLLNSLLKEVLQ